MNVRIAETDTDTRNCFVVMHQLRPAYDVDRFVEAVRRQREQGYVLVGLYDEGKVVAAAGYRIGDNLAWGKYLYVDDLVTDASSRSRGHGQRLLRWLKDTALEAGCGQLHLDSGVQRFAAHRFYLRFGMDITSHHFALDLTQDARDRSL